MSRVGRSVCLAQHARGVGWLLLAGSIYLLVVMARWLLQVVGAADDRVRSRSHEFWEFHAIHVIVAWAYCAGATALFDRELSVESEAEIFRIQSAGSKKSGTRPLF